MPIMGGTKKNVAPVSTVLYQSGKRTSRPRAQIWGNCCYVEKLKLVSGGRNRRKHKGPAVSIVKKHFWDTHILQTTLCLVSLACKLAYAAHDKCFRGVTVFVTCSNSSTATVSYTSGSSPRSVGKLRYLSSRSLLQLIVLVCSRYQTLYGQKLLRASVLLRMMTLRVGF